MFLTALQRQKKKRLTFKHGCLPVKHWQKFQVFIEEIILISLLGIKAYKRGVVWQERTRSTV